MSSFEDVYTDNLIHCPKDDYGAGIKTKIYYAPALYFERIKLPTTSSSYEDVINIVKEGILFKYGGWNSIDVLIGENELKQNLIGNRQLKKIKTELEIFIPGFNSKNLGFIKLHKNTPMVFIVIDVIGNNWLIGNLNNAAFFETIDTSTQKKYEDNSGTLAKISCNSSLYWYGNTQSWIDKETRRDFTSEFTKEFK